MWQVAAVALGTKAPTASIPVSSTCRRVDKKEQRKQEGRTGAEEDEGLVLDVVGLRETVA